MTATITLKGKPDEALRALLTKMLEEGAVKAVLALRRLEIGGGVAFSLMTDADALNRAEPLLPIMPTQGGKVLSDMTREEGFNEPVAAVVRPCEVRAFNELIKRNKAAADNLVFISLECPGVLPLQRSGADDVGAELDGYWKAAAAGKAHDGVRPVCTGCENFEPIGVDMTVRTFGSKDLGKSLTLRLDSERAQEIAKALKLDTGKDDGKAPAALEGMRKLRAEGHAALREEIDFSGDDMSKFIRQFGRCIGCHACSKVCPICYCQMCYFESRAAGVKPTMWRHDLEKKGATRTPPGTVFFHIGRMLHMGISCVACGMCEDVCPVDIPIGRIFKKVGEAAQGVFDYLPGADPEEEIPIRTFVEDELHEVER